MVELNTKANGLEMIFDKPYKAIVISWFFENTEIKKTVSETRNYVNKKIAPETVSRASVLIFLNECYDAAYLNRWDIIAKGGVRRLYQATMGTDSFWQSVSDEVNAKLSPFLKGQV